MHMLVRNISSSNPCPTLNRAGVFVLVCEVGGESYAFPSQRGEASSRAENTNTWAPGPMKIWQVSTAQCCSTNPSADQALSKTQTLGDRWNQPISAGQNSTKALPCPKPRCKLLKHNWEENEESPKTSAPALCPLFVPPRGSSDSSRSATYSSGSSPLCSSPTSHPRRECFISDLVSTKDTVCHRLHKDFSHIRTHLPEPAK